MRDAERNSDKCLDGLGIVVAPWKSDSPTFTGVFDTLIPLMVAGGPASEAADPPPKKNTT